MFAFELKLILLFSQLGREALDAPAMKQHEKLKDMERQNFLLPGNKQELGDILLKEKNK